MDHEQSKQQAAIKRQEFALVAKQLEQEADKIEHDRQRMRFALLELAHTTLDKLKGGPIESPEKDVIRVAEVYMEWLAKKPAEPVKSNIIQP
jgi:hypothetical protein